MKIINFKNNELSLEDLQLIQKEVNLPYLSKYEKIFKKEINNQYLKSFAESILLISSIMLGFLIFATCTALFLGDAESAFYVLTRYVLFFLFINLISVYTIVKCKRKKISKESKDYISYFKKTYGSFIPVNVYNELREKHFFQENNYNSDYLFNLVEGYDSSNDKIYTKSLGKTNELEKSNINYLDMIKLLASRDVSKIKNNKALKRQRQKRIFEFQKNNTIHDVKTIKEKEMNLKDENTHSVSKKINKRPVPAYKKKLNYSQRHITSKRKVRT